MTDIKTAFVCPFDLDRLTGTPIRAKTTIKSVAHFAVVSVIAPIGLSFDPTISLEIIGAGRLFHFVTRAVSKLRQIKPTVVHGFTTVSILPMFWYKLVYDWRVKIVFEMHGWTWFETAGKLAWPKRVIFLILDWFGFVVADAVIAMSFTQKNFLVKKLYHKKNITVLWGPVDFPIVYKELPQRSGLQVGYLGNSSWWQGLPEIIAAARLLESTNPEVKLVLAGFDYDDEDKFPRLPNIKYVGKVARTEVVSLIQDCDVMVSSRIKSPVSDLQYPHKLSEYLSSGRAVIASNTNDQAQIITAAKCGEVVDPFTAELLADAITKFASLSYDEKTRMGHNAVKYAQQHVSFEVFGQRLNELYGQLINSNK